MSTETKTKTTDKDTTPKADPAGAAAHNPFAQFAQFDPMAAWTTAQANFTKMMNEAFERAQAWADELATVETQMYKRAQAAVDTWAQLARDSFAYSAQLSAQMMKLGVEAARKAGVAA